MTTGVSPSKGRTSCAYCAIDWPEGKTAREIHPPGSRCYSVRAQDNNEAVKRFKAQGPYT